MVFFILSHPARRCKSCAYFAVFTQLWQGAVCKRPECRIRDNMHELAKTGRWLGGTTPTGYASESVKSITVDGKAKKDCKLKLLPDEAELFAPESGKKASPPS